MPAPSIATRISIQVFGTALLTISMGLAACAPRAELSLMNPPVSAGPEEAERFDMVAVTTRARQTPTSNIFTTNRSFEPNHALFEIVSSSDREPGDMGGSETVSGLAVERQAIITSRRALLDQIADRPVPRKVSVFVHGFNLNFPEAVMRTAQLSADDVIDGYPVLFAWPSEARLQGYLHDRDAVLVSRDALVQLLIDLVEDRRLNEVDILAHSMGAFLTVEAMRQLRLTGRGDVLDQLSVTLAGPDIDTDVFAAQMAVIGPMRRPVKILVAPDDRALMLSGRLSGDARLGALDVTDRRVRDNSAKYNIAIVDISELPTTDGLRHARYSGLGRTTVTMVNSANCVKQAPLS
ncbi:alpha/beta hydrolase [Paracoccus sp. TK19116]|uniref:Alpha/beta hydrolase n=1 Tax=Paracoccus albicereus TaxID=2922394 RepID=A0ABT1MMK8_9RHOB|nr:alpha/beta hydrolase [Paracoccus albicereus]MCQ0969522.1 alpha/beta hydrolase [Paracoccus albicereus]